MLMRQLFSRLRGLAVALAVLALTATAAFAARPASTPPAAAADGLARAAAAAGKVVPATGSDHASQGSADTTETEAADTDTEKAATTAPTVAGAPAAGTHGAVVSAAAQAATPAGFDNHGAYVSSIARQNHGQTTAASAKAKTKPTH
jgi:hypothetical protein